MSRAMADIHQQGIVLLVPPQGEAQSGDTRHKTAALRTHEVVTVARWRKMAIQTALAPSGS